MNIADRIQLLRKSKGISQEELADKIGVSRQAVSKWESEQSMPDIDKIVLLSEYFDTTTDYLLRGVEPTGKTEFEISAVIFSIISTVINGIGLIAAVFIWAERRTLYATGIGIALMLLGTGFFLIGQSAASVDKAKAKKMFFIPNTWILSFIPAACCFNLADGLLGGYSVMLAPVPLLGNSFVLYGLFWILYITACISVNIMLKKML